MSINHRRRLLKSYCSRWNRFDEAEEKSLVKQLSGDSVFDMEFGDLTYSTRSGPRIEDIHFVRVPPGSGASREEWIIYGIPGVAYATHPSSNLLAVLQMADEGRSVYKPIVTRRLRC